MIPGKGQFDMACEVDLVAAQLSATLRAARHHTLLICDKNVVNVLAYARLVLPTTAGGSDAARVEGRADIGQLGVTVAATDVPEGPLAPRTDAVATPSGDPRRERLPLAMPRS